MNSSAMPGTLQLGNPGASVNQQHGDPGSERELAKLKNHGKQPKKQSAPNFAAKANCKIKDARSLLTDAKMWQHKVDETQQKKASDSTVSLNLFKYMHLGT